MPGNVLVNCSSGPPSIRIRSIADIAHTPNTQKPDPNVAPRIAQAQVLAAVVRPWILLECS